MGTPTMTTGDVARALGLTRQRVHQLVVDGRIAFVSTPLGRLYHADEVERIAQEREDAKGAA